MEPVSLFTVGFAVAKIVLRALDKGGEADMLDDASGFTLFALRLRQQGGAENIGATIAKNMQPILAHEFNNPPPNDVTAAIEAVTKVLEHGLSHDEQIIQSVVSPAKLTSYLRTSGGGDRAAQSLGGVAAEIYNAIFTSAVAQICSLSPRSKAFDRAAPAFLVRSLVEIQGDLEANHAELLSRFDRLEQPSNGVPAARLIATDNELARLNEQYDDISITEREEALGVALTVLESRKPEVFLTALVDSKSTASILKDDESAAAWLKNASPKGAEYLADVCLVVANQVVGQIDSGAFHDQLTMVALRAILARQVQTTASNLTAEPGGTSPFPLNAVETIARPIPCFARESRDYQPRPILEMEISEPLDLEGRVLLYGDSGFGKTDLAIHVSLGRAQTLVLHPSEGEVFRKEKRSIVAALDPSSADWAESDVDTKFMAWWHATQPATVLDGVLNAAAISEMLSFSGQLIVTAPTRLRMDIAAIKVGSMTVDEATAMFARLTRDEVGKWTEETFRELSVLLDQRPLLIRNTAGLLRASVFEPADAVQSVGQLLAHSDDADSTDISLKNLLDANVETYFASEAARQIVSYWIWIADVDGADVDLVSASLRCAGVDPMVQAVITARLFDLDWLRVDGAKVKMRVTTRNALRGLLRDGVNALPQNVVNALAAVDSNGLASIDEKTLRAREWTAYSKHEKSPASCKEVLCLNASEWLILDGTPSDLQAGLYVIRGTNTVRISEDGEIPLTNAQGHFFARTSFRYFQMVASKTYKRAMTGLSTYVDVRAIALPPEALRFSHHHKWQSGSNRTRTVCGLSFQATGRRADLLPMCPHCAAGEKLDLRDLRPNASDSYAVRQFQSATLEALETKGPLKEQAELWEARVRDVEAVQAEASTVAGMQASILLLLGHSVDDVYAQFEDWVANNLSLVGLYWLSLLRYERQDEEGTRDMVRLTLNVASSRAAHSPAREYPAVGDRWVLDTLWQCCPELVGAELGQAQWISDELVDSQVALWSTAHRHNEESLLVLVRATAALLRPFKEPMMRLTPEMSRYDLAYEARIHGDREGSESLYVDLAAAGDAAAMNTLGLMAEERHDPSDARKWFKGAAEAGFTSAYDNWALLEWSNGDNAAARRLWEIAAGHGSSQAMFNLSLTARENGDVKRCHEWLRLAAEKSHPQAMREYGTVSWEAGDQTTGEYWLSRAALAGVAISAFELGERCYRARRVSDSLNWFLVALDLGVVQSYLWLAILRFDQADAPGGFAWARMGVAAGADECSKFLEGVHSSPGSVGLPPG